MITTAVTATASDLRAAIARRQIPLYKLAAQVGIHPGRLGMMLGGRLPLPADVADRINRTLNDENNSHDAG